MTTGRRKLLLADDSVTIQKVVSLTFADEGFEVVTAGDGEAALREIEAGAPDVVLADVFMPKLNGYEVCARIKGDARFRHIPVMLLVGTFEPFDEAEARKIGADDFLTKPFQSIRNLVNKVGGLLGGQSDQEQDTRDLSPPSARDDSRLEAKSTAASWNQAEAVETRRDATPGADSPAPYADLVADDATIETTTAEKLGGEYASPVNAESARGAGETITYFGQQAEPAAWRPAGSGQEVTGTYTAEEPRGQMSSNTWNAGAEETATDQAGQRTRAASAASSDVLLDLGDIEPPPAAAEADDFILDLAEDTPAYSRATSAPRQPATGFGSTASESSYRGGDAAGRPADYAGSFAEAAHGGTVEQSIAPQFSGGAYSAEGRHEQSPVLAGEPTPDSFAHEAAPSFAPPTGFETTPATYTGADAGGRFAGEGSATNNEDFYAAKPSFDDAGESRAAVGVRADQLSPEVIDQIARRAVEHLSERVVREIAWEVVPDLAERLVRQRLDEERQK